MTPEEKRRNDIQNLASQLNKDFAGDKQSIQISRAWFEALANGAKPADGKTELEGFQTVVAQTLINLEPFRRRLAENAKVISSISQSIIMPNLEAVKPMLKEIEDSLSRVSKFYNPPQKLTINDPLPPRMSETIQRGEMITEIRALRNQVEKLTDIKTPIAPQPIKEGAAEKSTSMAPDEYKISVKDREIWVNDYLIGKPHAVGSNFEFFDYVRHQPANTRINREALPIKFGNLSIKEQVKDKSFIKILNGLGFKGELLKAFFYQRGKDSLNYRGDEITKTDLEKAGVKITLFLKELELAHIKSTEKVVQSSPI